MPSKNDGSRFSAFRRLNERLETLYEDRPVVFNLIALGLARLLFGVACLVEWFLWVVR